MLLLGHRGARATTQLRENTVASFELALDHGCDGFEFDVRRSADGQPVICHDAKFYGRTISGAAAADLPELPSLDEIWRRFHVEAFLDVELKVAGLEPAVADLLRNAPATRPFVVSSFLPKVLNELHEIAPTIPLGLIADRPIQLNRWRKLPVQYVFVERTLITHRLTEEIQYAGRKIFVWTVNSPSTMRKLAGWGVDGIISDDTELLASTLGSPQTPRKSTGPPAC